ncbi:MAG: TIGR00282 family metallophosphoesterase [Erysipelotrichaceae bacterium]
MKILFIGDIVGRSGRDIVANKLPLVIDEYKPDFIIANGENAAHGKGISGRIYHQFKKLGIDCITMGNHTFSKDVIKTIIHELDDLVRPVNLIPTEYGQGYKVYPVLDKKLCVINLCGEIFMDRISESPFSAMDKILDKVEADYFIVDLHAEATSEKITFANYYQDHIHAVFGTHTHVQTADERIIGKTAFISDVGMCGAYDSVIGRDTDEVISNMVHKQRTKFEVATGPGLFQAVIIEIDEAKNRSLSIQRIQIRPE